MMQTLQTHYIKLNEHFCEPVLSGEKNFEIRRNDRGYQRGDGVVFCAVNDEGHLYGMCHEHRRLVLPEHYCSWGVKDEQVSEHNDRVFRGKV